LLVVGGVAFVFIYPPTRNWIFKNTQEGIHQVEGFPEAKTPKEAMELFEKAIKERNYKAAARYCNEDYAKLLERGHDGARAVGTKLDEIYNLLQRDQRRSPRATGLLMGVDPFPKNFDVDTQSIKEVKDKKGEFWEGKFRVIKPVIDEARNRDTEQPGDIARLDAKIFNKWPLMPEKFADFAHVQIKKEKDNVWKLQFTPKVKDCDYFLGTYKTYVTACERYIDYYNREKSLQPDEVGRKLLDDFSQAR